MADDNKNPLDVLEELLNQSGGGAGTGGGKVTASANEAEKVKEEAEKKLADELVEQRLEFEQQQAEQGVVDEIKLVEQREAITKIKDSEEYKARVQQDTDKKVDEEKKIVATDGFEIDQLDHKKV